MMPSVCWITPTWRRPETLPNLVACFLGQDYPRDRLSLIILDDAGQYGPACRGDRWQVFSVASRYKSLPNKFNALVSLSAADIIVVAEDDDSFLPWHTSAHVQALQSGPGRFSKPSTVLSDYPGHVITEPSAGRFHGSVAFWRSLWLDCDGWPETDAANFDQVMLSHFAKVGGVVDPIQFAPPSYVFRWHTGQYHGQSLADGPGDQRWYDRAKERGSSERVDAIVPRLDTLTQTLYDEGVPC